ncbi:SH3 domain-containing protein [Purpureocillium lavendulum]|uniref:SH3 domain-containing protein n=1 Tax=Purpureocillium lavendulum TaxID=1247861 RepID=A0AB34G1K4_9HYPO|nr:SH3 domain-containing protein [Purpureocillium lavendulum]
MSSSKHRRDWAYLAIIAVQLAGMVLLDLVGFYPKALYAKPAAPLHFLVTLRRFYLRTTGDPFFHASPAANHAAAWMRGFLYVELFVQLPLAAFLVYRLASRRRSRNGRDDDAAAAAAVELAALAFACLTFMGSVACCAELAAMGSRRLSPDLKSRLLYGTYLPFAIFRKQLPSVSFIVVRNLMGSAAAVMAVDMFARLHLRFRASQSQDVKAKDN